MKAIKQYTWVIKPISTPLIKKKCSKCKTNSLFYCSNKFRLNAQKRSIDVWLIYKCQVCDTTYNLTILSRTKPELIDKQLYCNFSKNDEDTAWKYAFDADTLKKNKVEIDRSKLEYDILYEKINLRDIAGMDVDLIEFEIQLASNISIRLNAVIRVCLNVSVTETEKMLSAGVISISPACTCQKHKIKNGIKVIVCRDKLKTYLEKTT